MKRLIAEAILNVLTSRWFQNWYRSGNFYKYLTSTGKVIPTKVQILQEIENNFLEYVDFSNEVAK